jgi:hypothetical protein
MILGLAADRMAASSLLPDIAQVLDVITRVGLDGCKSATRATSV